MVLEDSVIVTEEQFRQLYQRQVKRPFEALSDLGLLPLTIKSLATPQGIAFLHLATWTDLSGHISRDRFAPMISVSGEIQSYLEKCAWDLGRELKSSNKAVILQPDSGAFGRLMYCMGIPKPAKDDKAQYRKSRYARRLPKVYTAIADSKKRNPARMDLMQVIVGILLKDRLRINSSSRLTNTQCYIELNRHPSEIAAKKYGWDWINFLNKACLTRPGKELFHYTDVKTNYDKRHKLYFCRISLREDHIGYFATRNPPMLNIEVNF